MDIPPLTASAKDATKRHDGTDVEAAPLPIQIARTAILNTEAQAGRPEHVGGPVPRVAAWDSHKPGRIAWLGRQAVDALWAVRAIARHGRPKELFCYGGGIGDEVLITAVFRERAKRGLPLAVMMTDYLELFQNNPDVGQLIPRDYRFMKLSRVLRIQVQNPIYTYEYMVETDCHVAPSYPIIARMCKLSGLTGSVDIRPYLYLTDAEKREGRVAKRQVAIVSAGLSAKFKMLDKQWYPERFQAVVDALGDRFDFVQLGAATDPVLSGVIDLRGKTTLRQSAAILSQSLLQIAHVGMTMHLARAVDCRSVIIYGGREHPYQTGYGANENLYTPLPCAPCWKLNTCDFDRECMKRITPQAVVEAALRQAERHGEPLPVETYTIAPVVYA